MATHGRGSKNGMTSAYTLERLRASMLAVRTAMTEQLASYYLSREVLERINATIRQIPAAKSNELLVDIGCYGPILGPVHAILGYKRIGAVAKYDWGPCDSAVLPGWARERGIDLSVWFGDIEREPLPWADREADVVLMLEILEHFAVDPMFALAEANRILKPGGMLVLSTPNAASEKALIRLIEGNNPHSGLEYNGLDGNRHNRLYDANELGELFKCAGFSRIEVISIWESPTHLGRRLGTLLWFYSLLQKVDIVKQNGDILLGLGTKTSDVSERYPRFLYGDRALYRDWYRAMKRPATHAVSEADTTPVAVGSDDRYRI